MRKITEQAVKAFIKNEDFSNGNTTVNAVSIAEQASNPNMSTKLFLHGNCIARKCIKDNKERLIINFCGYPTATTKERLNGLFDILFGQRPFRTVNGQMKFGSLHIPIDEDVTFDCKGYLIKTL